MASRTIGTIPVTLHRREGGRNEEEGKRRGQGVPCRIDCTNIPCGPSSFRSTRYDVIVQLARELWMNLGDILCHGIHCTEGGLHHWEANEPIWAGGILEIVIPMRETERRRKKMSGEVIEDSETR
jgi:hypothetical protein